MSRLTIDTLAEFFNSDVVQKLLSQCKKPTILDVFGKKNSETVHSSIIGWILSNSDFLNYPTPAVLLFLRLLHSKASGQGIDNDMMPGIYSSSGIEYVEAEKERALGRNKIDLCVEVSLSKGNVFRIWIENKLFSTQTRGQLDKYFNYVRTNFSRNGIKDIFVYISQDKNNTPDNGEYIHITYQDLYDRVLLPLFHQSEIFENNRSSIYLKEYMDGLTSFGRYFRPIVKSKEYLDCLKEIYDRYRFLYFTAVSAYGIDADKSEGINPAGNNAGDKTMQCLKGIYNEYSILFLASIHEYGTEKEIEFFKTNSPVFEINYDGTTKTVSRYVHLVKETFSILLKSGIPAQELLRKLGRLDSPIPGVDNRIADDNSTKGAESCYSKGTVRRSGIYVSNQWCLEKVFGFINILKRHYPYIIISCKYKK